MSDHDEPTESSAPVTAEVEVVAVGEPEPTGEAPTPKSSLFAAVNARRVSIALVLIALAWLGVWAYTSDSAATSSSGTVATVAPPASTPKQQGQTHRDKGSSTTTLAPPPNLPRTAQAYATAFIDAWVRNDRTGALRVSTSRVVTHLFAQRPSPNERLAPQGCKPAGAFMRCTWSAGANKVVVRVRNASGSDAIRVVGVNLHNS
jgi:hypothetical protein